MARCGSEPRINRLPIHRPARFAAPSATKPTLYVLAGVNGAGKSSIGGALLAHAGLAWYNPDTFARALVQGIGMPQPEANAWAWQEGMVQLDAALAQRTPFAFETTLGGNTVCAKLRAASQSHDVRIWYCGLTSPEQHIARVRDRVAHGGHDIPTDKIYQRWQTSRANLVALMPLIEEVSVFDNSTTARHGAPIPDPKLVLHIKARQLLYPRDARAIADTPEWAYAMVEQALNLALPTPPP